MADRERARPHLEYSAERMRRFLETAVDGIITIDSRGIMADVNPAVERMFGYPQDELVGRNVNVLMPPPFREEHDGYLERFLRTGEARIIGIGREVRGLRRDGTDFPLHLSIAMQEIQGRNWFTGILRDLTAEHAAREREAGTARILETSVNEIFLFDAKTLRFIQANRQARANLGYSPEQLPQLTPIDIEPECGREAFERLIAPLRRGERDSVSFTTVHLRANGTTYPVEVHLQLTDLAGRPTFVAICVDLTERERLQRELLHAQKLEAVGRMAGALAHDFNNLLMGVISGCRMAARMLPPDNPARELLDEIQKEAQGGAGITRQLLDFSRKRSYSTRPCDLSAMVAASVRMFEKLLGEDVRLETRLKTGGTTIQADPDKLEQILMNLVVNARDAMPKGGALRIDVETELQELAEDSGTDVREVVRLSIADTGCGMDAATQARIFEPFFTTKRIGKGTGLGLSTVFGLTQEFGGTIEVSSAPDQGTTFRLSFPGTNGEAGENERSSDAKLSTGTEVVLLVEDAPLVRAGIRSVLKELGYEVVDAPDPEVALESFEALERRIDLLLTDIVMPVMSGPALARRIQERRPDVRILFMSAYSDEELVSQGKLQSGLMVLEKPFEDEELATAVRRALASAAPPLLVEP